MPRLPIEGLVEKKPYGRLKIALLLLVGAAIAFGIFVATRPKAKRLQKDASSESLPDVEREALKGISRKETATYPTWKGPHTHQGKGIRPSAFSAGIWKKIEAMDPQLRKWRHALHAHPELANRETWTSRYLAGSLGALKVELHKVPGSTGLVAAIRGRPGPVVALVAGMDALPIRETLNQPYASKVQTVFRGKKTFVSHTGGRDIEMTLLLGVATVLSSMDDRLPGTVLLLFQPASEQTPAGEVPGADALLRALVQSKIKMEALFWMSAKPQIRIGRLLVPEGRQWMGMTKIRVVVTGRGAGTCKKRGGAGCADPVLAASQLLVNLQAQMARQIARPGAVHLTVHSLRAQTKEGLAANRVVIEAVLKWRDTTARNQALSLLDRTTRGLSVSSAVRAAVTTQNLRKMVPSDPALAQWVLPTARRALGPSGVLTVPLSPPGVGFARYRRLVPAVALGLGTHSRRLGSKRRLKTATFDVDEECLSVGVHLLANIALDYLLERSRTSMRTPARSRRVAASPVQPR